MSNPTDSGGPSPSQPLMLLAFTFFFIFSPWYFSGHGENDVEAEGFSFGSPAVWLPIVLVLLILAIYISWCVEQSSSSRVTVPEIADGSSIHRIGGSPWGIGALLLMLMFIRWWQSMMQE
ncbi:hypothetical protein SUGI_1204620 [Cryptomeria japonica]|nr:hypothetical protein SUGI_1204620 [Cryptomeria japonica]